MCDDYEPICNIAGKCVPYDGDKGISSCKYCGSEMVELEVGWLNSYYVKD